jgi:AraC family transcriptional regulator
VGETLHAFVRRLRLERALHLMSHDRRRSLTEIALACGFASSSDFSRSFKQRYGVAPKRFDLATFRDSHREQLQSASAPFGAWARRTRATAWSRRSNAS